MIKTDFSGSILSQRGCRIRMPSSYCMIHTVANLILELKSRTFLSLWSTCGLWCVSVRRLGIRLFDFCSGQAVVRCKRRWR